LKKRLRRLDGASQQSFIVLLNIFIFNLSPRPMIIMIAPFLKMEGMSARMSIRAPGNF